jgi:hypothetical protein
MDLFLKTLNPLYSIVDYSDIARSSNLAAYERAQGREWNRKTTDDLSESARC